MSAYVEAAQKLLELADEHAKYPIEWVIKGVPILLQEFVMPSLGEIVQVIETKNTDGRAVRVSTKRLGPESERKRGDTKEGGLASEAILTDKNAQLAIVSTKGSNSWTRSRNHTLVNGLLSPLPLDPITKDGKNDTANKPCVFTSLAKFEYCVYVRKEVDYRPDKTPFMIAEHCPNVETERSLSKIAEDLRFQVEHHSVDIATVVAALQSASCPFATILPSYLSRLHDNRLIARHEIMTNQKHDAKLSKELKNHSVTLVWSPGNFPPDEFYKNVARSLIELLARKIENKLKGA